MGGAREYVLSAEIGIWDRTGVCWVMLREGLSLLRPALSRERTRCGDCLDKHLSQPDSDRLHARVFLDAVCPGCCSAQPPARGTDFGIGRIVQANSDVFSRSCMSPNPQTLNHNPTP